MSENEIRHPKSVFSKIGFALFLYILIVNILSIVVGIICNKYFLGFANGPYYDWVVSAVIQYGIGFPIVCFILKDLPNHRFAGQKLGFRNMFGCFALISFCSYAGGIISDWVNNFFGAALEKEISEPLDDMLLNSPLWLSFVVVVLMGPIFEELIFRRLIIDKIRPYGEMLAVIFSGMAFGAFHGNFSQFFYAAASGMIFAYVYLRTMKLVYPAVLHISFNFFFGFIPLVIQKYFPLADEVEAVSNQTMLSLAVNSAFVFLALGLAVFGFIYFIRKKNRIMFFRNYYEIPKGSRLKFTVFNGGMLAFGIICLVEFILYLLV